MNINTLKFQPICQKYANRLSARWGWGGDHPDPGPQQVGRMSDQLDPEQDKGVDGTEGVEEKDEVEQSATYHHGT